jgi:hypothetical protein
MVAQLYQRAQSNGSEARPRTGRRQTHTMSTPPDLKLSMQMRQAVIRTLALSVIVSNCPVTTVYTQRPVLQPELIAGPWEVSSPSGIDGVVLEISTSAEGSSDRRTTMSQTVDIRAYHRKDRRESFRWYRPAATGPGDADAVFDGRRLRIHSDSSLDITFDPRAARWTGTWVVDGERRDIVLERPNPAAGVPLNQFCGDWGGLRDPTVPWSGGLHIAQSADGTLTAWMDRTLELPLAEHRRNGESLRVISAEGDALLLELSTSQVTGPRWEYAGRLSGDGSHLVGVWGTDSSARDAFSSSSGVLTAPSAFARISQPR